MSTYATSEITPEIETYVSGETESCTDDPVAAVASASLPPVVSEFADLYDARVGDRDAFLWKWIHSLFPSFELSCVTADRTESLRTEKTLLTIFVTVLDDLVECHGDEATFAEARRLPFDPKRVQLDRDDVDGEILGYLADLWIELDSRLRKAPNYDDYVDLFQYDLRQTINSIEYGEVVAGNLGAANSIGYFRYASHNMCMFPYSDVDLMYSPEFVESDLGALRATLWDAQELARIGNDITTWEREIAEGDFSAGIVAHALQEGIITPSSIRGDVDANELIETIRSAGIEDTFANRWIEQYEATVDGAEVTESVNLTDLIVGMKTVFRYHLKSRGKK